MKKVLISLALGCFLYSNLTAQTLCPDGTYVSGNECNMAPDGSYVGGEAQLAPDGSYVGGEPKMAPDGSYTGE